MQREEESRQTFWTVLFLGILLIAGIVIGMVSLALTNHNVEMTAGQTQSTTK